MRWNSRHDQADPDLHPSLSGKNRIHRDEHGIEVHQIEQITPGQVVQTASNKVLWTAVSPLLTLLSDDEWKSMSAADNRAALIQ